MWQFDYQDGTLVVRGAEVSGLPPGFKQDDRVGGRADPDGSTRKPFYTRFAPDRLYGRCTRMV